MFLSLIFVVTQSPKACIGFFLFPSSFQDIFIFTFQKKSSIYTNLYHPTPNRTLIVINCRIIFSFCLRPSGKLVCASICRIHLSFVKLMPSKRLEKLGERRRRIRRKEVQRHNEASHKAIKLIILFRPP